MKKIWSLLAPSLVLAVAGCASSTSDTSQQPSALELMSFVDLMRATYSADYEPINSPDELVATTDISLAGHVVSVEDGRAVSIGGEAPEYNVTVGVAVDTMTKDDPARIGSLVYVELPRPENVGAESIEAKLPVGTSVFLMGYRVSEDEGDVANQWAGREQGATLYHPAVQGMFVESANQPFTGVLEPVDDMPEDWRTIDSMSEMIEAADPQ